MTATVTNIRREIDLRRTTPDGLYLRWIGADETIAELDEKARASGNDLSPADDARWSECEDLKSGIEGEFKRRLNEVLGGAVTIDDLIGKGVL